MTNTIEQIFKYLSIYFDKIPFLNKIKGSRFLFSAAGMVISYGLMQYDVGNPDLVKAIYYGFMALAGLALNAKGRPE